LTLAFEPGDTLHLAGTWRGGVGLSLLRDGRLVVAVGAVSAVPLENVKANTPFDLVQKADAIFQERDPEFHLRYLPHYPVQIEIQNEMRLLYGGRRTRIGEYEVWVQHGFVPGIPVTGDECVGIALKGACGYVTASCSAMLIELGIA
jgi:hypothetical protein